jgi:hypothetical protein
MRANGTPERGGASFESLKPVCQILILHEDFSAYTRAVEVSRGVMEHFGSELDFDIKCWNFIELADAGCARHAAKTAAAADIVLISTRAPVFPVKFIRWLDFDFVTRFRPDGVLALVLDAPTGPALVLEQARHRLEQLAGRLGMDFISLLPGDSATRIHLPPSAPAQRPTANGERVSH